MCTINGEAKLTTVYDVSSADLIDKLAKYLADNFDEINPPAWAVHVKTGAQSQRPPDQHDWWYTRCASLLRKIYIKGPLGISKLRAEYGGKQKGNEPAHFKPSGSNILRKALHQLGKAGLVESKPRGRVLTGKGQSLLDKLAKEITKSG